MAALALEFRDRDRGTLGKVLVSPSGGPPPRPVSRCGGNKQAEQNLVKARGSMAQHFDQEAARSYSSPRPNPKVREGGKEGGKERGTYSSPRPNPKVREGGKEGGKERGTYSSPRPNPKVRPRGLRIL